MINSIIHQLNRRVDAERIFSRPFPGACATIAASVRVGGKGPADQREGRVEPGGGEQEGIGRVEHGRGEQTDLYPIYPLSDILDILYLISNL